jgi:tetratricopeptide (TPR) repeat protein
MVLRTPAAVRPRSNTSSLAVEQAVAALRSGEPAEAERALRAHLLANPHDATALAKLGDIVRDQGRPSEAILLYRRALQADRAIHPVRIALARLLHARGEPQLALDQIEQLPAPIRASFDLQAFEAALLGQLGRHDPEIAVYEKLVAVRPDAPSLWNSLGNALKYAGRTDDAVRALRRSVGVRPGYGEGWWSLANVKTVRFEARDLSAMRKALAARPAPEDALHLHFALGKALEDRNDYEQSFRYYAEGNRIRAAGFSPEQMRATAFVDRTIAAFGGPLFDRLRGSGDPSSDPIFIVGLQRSGSTLVEQILASHPQIEGTSELLVMQQLWGDVARESEAKGRSIWQDLSRLAPERLRRLGSDYLERTRQFRRTNRPYFIDKLPANWMNAGLIRLALPNAKIIDARRHPMACGFSNFKQQYATGVAFAYSQQSIGAFYADYLRLMDHFDRVQPGAVHHILNERLIDDPEGEVRRLLDFVGVPFDSACLEFHRNGRAVATPSAEQVRRPINRDGVDYWRKYEAWLDPLKDALGPALDDWDKASS